MWQQMCLTSLEAFLQTMGALWSVSPNSIKVLTSVYSTQQIFEETFPARKNTRCSNSSGAERKKGLHPQSKVGTRPKQASLKCLQEHLFPWNQNQSRQRALWFTSSLSLHTFNNYQEPTVCPTLWQSSEPHRHKSLHFICQSLSLPGALRWGILYIPQP